ncbi:hypothetical protein DPMN_181719 [Dreissena polymorpha]|uniref:Uncharacterized protein n=1 Tax=Dreissena polymorpha TaxID=45954 RepID=A0A9D4I3Y6_DREPO|nr:hypothetical protein DPMN_181719 [Dreissena polymorpha]
MISHTTYGLLQSTPTESNLSSTLYRYNYALVAVTTDGAPRQCGRTLERMHISSTLHACATLDTPETIVTNYMTGALNVPAPLEETVPAYHRTKHICVPLVQTDMLLNQGQMIALI